MTSFDKTLKLAARSLHLLPGCEWVDYIPATGSRRKIRAVITRLEAEPMPDVEGGSFPGFEVLVENDGTNGITSLEIDTGGDKIEIAKKVNRPPAVLRLTEIINHDAGMMLLKAI